MRPQVVILLFYVSIFNSNGNDLYPSYTLSADPIKVAEWSNDRALAYITTVRLFDYDHHIFQYRLYPCQYYYTDEIQMHHENDTAHQCQRDETTSNYEYRFKLHLDSRHVEPVILRNLAIHCVYVNCSFSRLSMKYLQIGWNLKGRELNPECSFDINQPYAILDTPYTISESITLRCQTFSACNQSRSILETSFPSYTSLLYGSSYDLDLPYCSLEKKLADVIERNLRQTNSLLQKLIDSVEHGFAQTRQIDSTTTKSNEQ